MKYGLIVGVVLLLSSSLCLPTIAASHQGIGATTTDAWLAQIDGVKVLYVKGSPYEMGYEHGTLLKDAAIENFRALEHFAESFGYNITFFIDVWYHVQPYVPSQYIDEMQGMADALNLSLEQVAAAHMIPMFVHCSSFAAWGSSTTTGALVHARSLDFPIFITDPLTNHYFQDNAVLIVREPDYGYASLDPSFAGLVGSLGGINEAGIATGVLSSWSRDETIEGTPMIFRQRLMLDNAATIADALYIIDTNRTYGWNFVISDAHASTSYAVEQTANYSYMGSWNDSVEATPPFWQLPQIVRRTNIFINETTASTQRGIYNPRLFPVLGYLSGYSKLAWSIVPAYLPWVHYRALSHALEEQVGHLDVNTSMALLRQVYQGSHDPLFHLFVILHFYMTLHQWVADPLTGDMVISFAKGTHNAFNEPIHRFNLFNLLNYTP